jgi:hypothetical protein
VRRAGAGREAELALESAQAGFELVEPDLLLYLAGAAPAEAAADPAPLLPR